MQWMYLEVDVVDLQRNIIMNLIRKANILYLNLQFYRLVGFAICVNKRLSICIYNFSVTYWL